MPSYFWQGSASLGNHDFKGGCFLSFLISSLPKLNNEFEGLLLLVLSSLVCGLLFVLLTR